MSGQGDTFDAVVVGGGIVGMLAAILLGRQGRRVALVEREGALGGLLRSVRTEAGLAFDHGTHVALATGVPALDSVLCRDMDDRWEVFDESLREGHYWNGRLNGESGCLDARTLGAEACSRGLAELLDAGDGDGAANLHDYVHASYGPTFADSVFRPVMRRLTGQPLETLHPDAHRSFSLTRLIAVETEDARKLKSSPRYDAKIAWPRVTDGRATARKFYPKSGGVGLWIDDLAAQLRELDVVVLTARSVEKVARTGRRVSGIALGDGRTLSCGVLVWTVAAPLYLRAAGIPFAAAPPPSRDLALFHMAFDGEFTSRLHWLSCYDEDLLSYRITLYPNFRRGDRPARPHHLTVEVLSDGIGDGDAVAGKVRDEVYRLGLVEPASRVIWERRDILPRAFPVPTVEAVASVEQQTAAVSTSADNLVFLGRAAGAHFLYGLLIKTYEACGEASLSAA